MTKPTSYFDRTQKLHSMGDVNALLERRAPGVLAKVLAGGRAIPASEDSTSGESSGPDRLPLEPTQEAVKPDALTERRAALLSWMPPVRNKDGSGYQCAGGTEYVVRKTLTNDKWQYWAWFDKKLLGYSYDIAIAREHCQIHADSQP